jgi:redox-sensitive bicupin YhaK (pirin superfamily)
MKSPILQTLPLGNPPWVTADPFLFCVHHDDQYPAGNEHQGPEGSLDGRDLGQDFAGKDGWRMYHGDKVPGFPGHPHRGFETVTLVRNGLIDHSDSLGATARFGHGDVQWLTAGKGIVHAEMFPLVKRGEPNPTELFQIWLNLPAEDKAAPPHFSMLWSHDIPKLTFSDAQGRKTLVTVAAGELEGRRAPPPPPRSWASRPDTDVAIWTVKLEAGATWTLPPARNPAANRVLYFFDGKGVRIAERDFREKSIVVVASGEAVRLEAPEGAAELLMLQGRPIGQPVVQYGPFVMNTRQEIQQAFQDYQATQFGGWPFDRQEPVHPREEGRFARHADGRVERPSQ